MSKAPQTSWSRTALAAALVALAVSGCLFSPDKDPKCKPGDPTCNPPTTRYKVQSHPDSVLANFTTAYEEKDFTEYEKLIDQDNFAFEFSQVDIGSDPELDPVWFWAQEREATKNLFESDIVFDIRVNLTYTLPTGRPNQGSASQREAWQAIHATPADAVPDTTRLYKIEITRAFVEIDTRGEDNGPLTLQVPGDRQTFFMRYYPDELGADNQPIWRLVRWRDGATAGRTTVGSQKRHFGN